MSKALHDSILECMKQIQGGCFVNGLPGLSVMRLLQNVYQMNRDTFSPQVVQKILSRFDDASKYDVAFIYQNVVANKHQSVRLPVPTPSHRVWCVLRKRLLILSPLERARITVNTVKTWLITDHAYKGLGCEYAAWLFVYNRPAPRLDMHKLTKLLAANESQEVMWYIKQACPEWQECFSMTLDCSENAADLSISECEFCQGSGAPNMERVSS